MLQDEADEFQVSEAAGVIGVWRFFITLHSVKPVNSSQLTVKVSYSKNCSLFGDILGKTASETKTQKDNNHVKICCHIFKKAVSQHIKVPGATTLRNITQTVHNLFLAAN